MMYEHKSVSLMNRLLLMFKVKHLVPSLISKRGVLANALLGSMALEIIHIQDSMAD